ncbi:hypothetical protein [Tenacibaculum aiptasiae]|uniref:hypothetical protein n=1 Tax=Tenacibaculum aiptasiae TaxID=426481 RepID=UPI00232D5DB1|nr:hypothetical protein [Tenacibaculum aiptasiae]
MENQNKQIANIQLHLSENCSDLEKEILEKYWQIEDEEFTNSPRVIKKKYNISQTELTQITSKHATLSFYLFCQYCNSYEKHEAKSKYSFNNILSGYPNRYNKPFTCDNCKEERKKQFHLKQEKERYELSKKLNEAFTNKNWENLSNFEKGVLKNSLAMNFYSLKKHYGNILGQNHYIKFIRALETLENQNLLILKKDFRGWIKDHDYLPKLLEIKDQINFDKETTKSEANFNSETNELKLKLTIDKEKLHPDSPLYSGIITFKEQIIINPGIEYVFAQ